MLRKAPLLGLVILLGGIWALPAEEKHPAVTFSFNLVEGPMDIREINSIPPGSVPLQKTPIFTNEEVVSCSKDEGAIALTEEAFQRFQAVPYTKPFVICLDGTPAFLGVVWKEISSVACPSLVAYASPPLQLSKTPGELRTIKIAAGYPERKYFQGLNPDADRVILNALASSTRAEAEKLVPVEEQLANLQMEESVLMLRYRPENRKVREMKAQIASLESIEGIKNERYFDYLKATLEKLQVEKAKADTRYRPANPIPASLNAKIKRVEELLEEK